MIDTQSLRIKLLDLAIRGRLTEQVPEDGTSAELYQQIQQEKRSLIKTGKIKKEKPLPIIKGEEIPFCVPDNWMWVRLGDIAEVSGGLTPASSELRKTGSVPYFKVSDMNVCGNETYMTHASSYISDSYCGKVFPAGTIIYPKNGGAALTNKRRILVTDSAVDLNTGGCTPFLTTCTDWLRLFFETIDFGTLDIGSNISTINATIIKRMLCPLPPLAEQKRIVSIVEKAFSVLHYIDVNQTKYVQNTSVLKSKLIDAAIHGQLTEQLAGDGTATELYQQIQQEKQFLIKTGKIKKERPLPIIKDEEIPFSIPDNWIWVRLGSIATVVGRIGFRGYTKNDIVAKGNGAISLSPANITKDGVMTFNNCSYVSWHKYEESPEIIVNEEDIVIVKTGSSYGKSAIVTGIPERTTINPQLALVKNVLCNRYYLNYVLKSTMARKKLEDFVVGSATPTFSQEDLSCFLVPLPPLMEQERIVSSLNSMICVFN